ncbi:hypothetical protein OUHCRE19_42710 [Enterobacter asburiae]
MAITKRCIVSFDMKFVASSEDVEGYTKRMLGVSRKIAKSRIVAMSFCEPRSCYSALSS